MIEAITRETDLPVSIDTYKGEVAQAAIEAGASMINDVWALQRDPDMLRVAAEADVPVVLMHNQVGTEYNDLGTRRDRRPAGTGQCGADRRGAA